jgi:hypothetical protein
MQDDVVGNTPASMKNSSVLQVFAQGQVRMATLSGSTTARIAVLLAKVMANRRPTVRISAAVAEIRHEFRR